MSAILYSLEEVAKNDGTEQKRTWIIIKDNVYDVTDYLNDHPGGAELITEWAGKDGTKAFQDFGHSSDAKRDLSNFKIGELREEDRKGKNRKRLIETSIKVDQVDNNNKENRRSFCNYLTCGLCC